MRPSTEAKRESRAVSEAKRNSRTSSEAKRGSRSSSEARRSSRASSEVKHGSRSSEAKHSPRSSISAKDRSRSAAAAAASAAASSKRSARAEAKEEADVAAKTSAKDYARSSYTSSSSESASEFSTSRYKARKGMSTGKKVVIGVVIALVVALAACGVAAAVWYNNIANNIKGNDNITNLVVPAADEPYYVLLMGSDDREGWEEIDDTNSGERTDSIMVARIDEKNKKVAILSVPRDLRVSIPGHGYGKINSLIEYGGYNLLIDKLNEILGIKINYYATVHFLSFIDLVDTLGGVTVEVPEGTSTYDGEGDYPAIILPAGDEVLLDGDQALILARCRHGWPQDQGAYAMGDYQRTLNQRNLIKAIAKEVLKQDITKLPGLIETLSKSIETNMSVDKLIALAQVMKGMDVETMEATQLPIGASTIKGEWEALMYQDVFELMDKNFKEGLPLYDGLGNFSLEANDDDVHGNYIDGPVYAYTTYSQKYGSPYSSEYTPSSFTQEAINGTRGGAATH